MIGAYRCDLGWCESVGSWDWRALFVIAVVAFIGWGVSRG